MTAKMSVKDFADIRPILTGDRMVSYTIIKCSGKGCDEASRMPTNSAPSEHQIKKFEREGWKLFGSKWLCPKCNKSGRVVVNENKPAGRIADSLRKVEEPLGPTTIKPEAFVDTTTTEQPATTSAAIDPGAEIHGETPDEPEPLPREVEAALKQVAEFYGRNKGRPTISQQDFIRYVALAFPGMFKRMARVEREHGAMIKFQTELQRRISEFDRNLRVIGDTVTRVQKLEATMSAGALVNGHANGHDKGGDLAAQLAALAEEVRELRGAHDFGGMSRRVEKIEQRMNTLAKVFG